MMTIDDDDFIIKHLMMILMMMMMMMMMMIPASNLYGTHMGPMWAPIWDPYG